MSARIYKMRVIFLSFAVIIAVILSFMPFTPVRADEEPDLAVNTSVQGTIGSKESIWYNVDVPSDGDISFELSVPKQFFYVSMYLYSEDMYRLEYNTDSQNKFIVYDQAIGASPNPAKMSFKGLKSGKYHVLLKALSADSPSAYDLSCSFTAAPLENDAEPNDTPDKAAEIRLDYEGTGHISYADGYVLSGANGDLEDWYKVNVARPGTLKLKFQAIPGQYADCFTLRTYKSGYKNEYDYLTLNYTGGKNTVTNTNVENLTPGVYYIRVSGYVNYYSSYNLTTSFIPKNIPAVSIKLSATKITTYVGGKLTLKATTTPPDSTDTPLAWSSSNPRVAKVDNLGNVTALFRGTTVITVKTKNGKSATCKLTVTLPVKVTGIKLNTVSATLDKGKSITLKATVNPANASNKTIQWASSNNKVATVSSNGIVKAVGAGTATITAKAADGSGKSALCKVRVK